MTTAIRDRLPRLTKFLYGISDFGFACTDTTMQVLVRHLHDRCGRIETRLCRRSHLHRAHLGLYQRPVDRFLHRPDAHPLGPPAAHSCCLDLSPSV